MSSRPARSLLDAVIVAGGSSRRMGFNKILAKFSGRTVLEHSVRAFEECRVVGRIVVVCSAGSEEVVRRIVAICGKLHAVVPGGKERGDSVMAGIRALGEPSEWIAVHDAARPLVRPGDIERCDAAAREAGAAALAERAVDTLHRTDGHRVVIGTVPRENLWRVQTPQIFARRYLARFDESNAAATDEISRVLQCGGRAVMVEAGSPNFKLTVPSDLPLAGAVYSLWR